MRVIVVTYPTPKDIKKFFQLEESDYIIAVDQAVLALYKQRIKIDLAVGDFDSLTNHGILNQLNVVRLSPEKDVTDTYQALIEASKIEHEACYLIGGIGGERIEHFMVHTMLFNHFPNLIMKDENSTLFLLEKGMHKFNDPKVYYSFFAYPKSNISLSGFKYNLTSYSLTTYNPLCISNELIQDEGKIHVHEGKILVVMSLK